MASCYIIDVKGKNWNKQNFFGGIKVEINEARWDKLLRIQTTGRDDSHADQYRYPYEPTPYAVLERLANDGFMREQWEIRKQQYLREGFLLCIPVPKIMLSQKL